jgi:hypothetical protein
MFGAVQGTGMVLCRINRSHPYRQFSDGSVQCPRIVYTDVNGLFCKIQKEPSHQKRSGQRFIARPEGPPLR